MSSSITKHLESLLYSADLRTKAYAEALYELEQKLKQETLRREEAEKINYDLFCGNHGLNTFMNRSKYYFTKYKDENGK